MIDDLITAGTVHDALRRQQKAAEIELEKAESAKDAKDEAAVDNVKAVVEKLGKLEADMNAAHEQLVEEPCMSFLGESCKVFFCRAVATGGERVVQKAKGVLESGKKKNFFDLTLLNVPEKKIQQATHAATATHARTS